MDYESHKESIFPVVICCSFPCNILSSCIIVCKWASTRENLSSGLANNKGADQTAQPRSLISGFVIRFLDSIIPKLATSIFFQFSR